MRSGAEGFLWVLWPFRRAGWSRKTNEFLRRLSPISCFEALRSAAVNGRVAVLL